MANKCAECGKICEELTSITGHPSLFNGEYCRECLDLERPRDRVIYDSYLDGLNATRNHDGMRVSLQGCIKHKGPGALYAKNELSKNYEKARQAWLDGDLETVGKFFGLYT